MRPDRQEVLAIAEHEHLPEIAAAALASYLVHQEKYGLNRVRDMIVDDIRKRVVTKSMFWFSFMSSIIFSECILKPDHNSILGATASGSPTSGVTGEMVA